MQYNITTSLIVSLSENGFGLDELIYRVEELANKKAFPQLLKTDADEIGVPEGTMGAASGTCTETFITRCAWMAARSRMCGQCRSGSGASWP